MNDFLSELKYVLKSKTKSIPLKKITTYILIFMFVAFLLLSIIIAIFSTAEFEAEWSRELQEERSPIMDFLMKASSFFGEQIVAITMIVASALLFAFFGYVKEGIFLILTSLGSVINFGLKILINRPRPTDDLVTIIARAEHQSFPSGHTVHYVVYFGMLMILIFRIHKIKVWIRLLVALICLTLIFSVPFSRVYLGAHWASDVTAGFMEGIIILSLLLFLYFKKTPFLDKLNRKTG